MPHHPNSPFAQYADDTLQWLHLRNANGDRLTALDVARVFEANPQAEGDEILRQLVVKALRGKLPAKKGRPPHNDAQKTFILAAEEWLREETVHVRRERASRVKGDKEPGLIAADRLAAEMAPVLGPISGQALRNLIARTKKQ